MSGRAFLDTNVLVSCFDPGAPAKQLRAMDLIADALHSGAAVLSTQVVQEFLNLATRKFASAFTASDLRVYLDRVLMPLCAVFPDAELYRLGLELREETGWSFYDCLIVAGALRARCDRLLSEDLQDGRTLHGVTVENPFRNVANR